jgi:hypothetical protein
MKRSTVVVGRWCSEVDMNRVLDGEAPEISQGPGAGVDRALGRRKAQPGGAAPVGQPHLVAVNSHARPGLYR